jgi:hypothetical protein
MSPEEFKGRLDVLKTLVLGVTKQMPLNKAVQVKKYSFSVDPHRCRITEMRYVPYGMTHRMVSVDLLPYEEQLKTRDIVKTPHQGCTCEIRTARGNF